MDAILIYSAKVAAVMAVFHIFYRVLLSKERLFKMNRVVLVLTVLLSFLLPLCVITFTKTIMVDGSQLSKSVGDVGSDSARNFHSFGMIALLVYCLGCVVVLAYTIYSMMLVRNIIRRSTRYQLSRNVNLFVTDKNITPFSWGGAVVISQNDYDSGSRDVVIAHERAHAELGHFYDLLFVNLCCAVQWFNPTVWLLREDLIEIHEYEADNTVLESGYNARDYQLLLVQKVVCSKFYYSTNNLTNKTLKNRIAMMLKKKDSDPRSRFKLLYVVPLMALSLFIFSKSITVYEPVASVDSETVRKSQENKQTIFMIIDSDKSVSIESAVTGSRESFGTDYTAMTQYCKKLIDENRNSEYILNIKAAPELPMGVVTDIRSYLRNIGVKYLKYQ